MTRSSSPATRRSGDPRKRATAARPQDPRPRRRLLVALLVGVLVCAAAAVLALRDGDEPVDADALAHAETACDLVDKAEEAARGQTDARYAASVLVLDQAIIESGRAAKADLRFSDLDLAVQAVHTAAHTGDPAKYDAAMDSARTLCRSSLA